MIAYEVTGKSKQRRVSLSIPATAGWMDRFPRVRVDNGVTLVWWDFDNGKPLEKLTWSAKTKTLKIPIPFAKEATDDLMLIPKKTSAGVETAGIRISVPNCTADVPLGSVRVAESTSKLITYALDKLNEHIKFSFRASGGAPAESSIWEDLMATTKAKYSPEAVDKLGEAIEQLGAEIDTRLDAIAEQVTAIATARSRIDFLHGLRQKWSIPGSTEPSDIDMP